MPSQRRTNKNKNAGRKRDDFREQRQQHEHDRVDQQSDDDRTHEDADAQPRRWRRIGIPVPPASTVSTVSAVSGGSGLTAAIITGHVQPGVVWPAVTLVIAGMAYDVARQALHRRRT